MTINNYRFKTTEALIKAYAHEANRIDRRSAETTKRLIKAELIRRFNATLTLLDDKQTVDNPDGTIKYLLGI